MKTLAIGDTHLMCGLILPLVDKNIKNIKIDRIVFTGDYTDQWLQQENVDLFIRDLNFLYNWKTQKENEGIEVVCLLGNHDVPYILNWPLHYTLQGHENRLKVQELLLKLKPQISCFADDWLISHGGYLGQHKFEEWHQTPFLNAPNSHDDVYTNLRQMDLDVGFCRGGYNYYGGPLWADIIEEFKIAPSENYPYQCVSHRPLKCVSEFNYENKIMIGIDTFSLIKLRDYPFYKQHVEEAGVVLLEGNDYMTINIPEWIELKPEVICDYFEPEYL